jgi:hypothetical protein
MKRYYDDVMKLGMVKTVIVRMIGHFKTVKIKKKSESD